MIVTSNITMQFGAKPLFENISVKFQTGNRYGLIGANGCGKSTLMKILGGDLEPSAGNVNIAPDLRVGKLRQDQFGFEEYSVIDTVLYGHTELWAVKSERDAIYSKAEMTEEDGMRAAELEGEFAEMDGYSAEARAGELLLGVGIDEALHYGPMSEVAPGYKLRVLLAQALFAEPEVLLLDEPTNNLDIDTIRWLEETINAREATMVIISHDRHFLNMVCTHMADLDYGRLQVYPGNYDDFMLASTQARERTLANNAKKQAQIKDLQAFVARFKANKSKSRQATSRLKQIDKIQLDDIKPSSRQNPFIRFEFEKKLHRNAVELQNLSAGYDGEQILPNMDLILEAGEKVAVIGPNGIGKSTFLKALVSRIEPMSGTVKWAENAGIGYFAQDHAEEFEGGEPLLDWMTQWGNSEDDEQVIRGILGRLLFSRDEIHKPCNVISGGEEGRMLFGKLMLGRTNVLVMDEPTNHLDMESIESLNYALDLYQGTLIFVSHDREFVNSLATRIIELKPGGGYVDYKGGYDDYLASQGIE